MRTGVDFAFQLLVSTGAGRWRFLRWQPICRVEVHVPESRAALTDVIVDQHDTPMKTHRGTHWEPDTKVVKGALSLAGLGPSPKPAERQGVHDPCPLPAKQWLNTLTLRVSEANSVRLLSSSTTETCTVA